MHLQFRSSIVAYNAGERRWSAPLWRRTSSGKNHSRGSISVPRMSPGQIASEMSNRVRYNPMLPRDVKTYESAMLGDALCVSRPQIYRQGGPLAVLLRPNGHWQESLATVYFCVLRWLSDEA